MLRETSEFKVVTDSRGRKSRRFAFICDCGNTKWLPKKVVRDGATKSCGCLRKKKERENLEQLTNLGFSGATLTGQIFKAIQRSASQRGIEFTISIVDAWVQYERQSRKCPYTGYEIVMQPHLKSRERREKHCKYGVRSVEGLRYASLDRIDSQKGYVVGNIQWVWAPINLMKWQFSHEDFIAICKDIVKHSCAA